VARYFKGEIIVGKDLMVVQRGEGETIMKLKLLLAVVTAALGFASACPAQSQDLASQIVGVWKYVSVNNKEVATGKMTYPLGEKPNGYIVYTKGGRVIFTVVGDNRPQPAVLVLRRLNVLACSTRCLPVAEPTRSKVTRVW
jgi:lipocalin-like protein